MPSPSTPSLPSPGLRAAVLLLSTVLVLSTAIAVSVSVSDHLRKAAVNEAVRAAEPVVLGYMGTAAIPGALADPSSAAAQDVNVRLGDLVAAGQILRIKVWAPDGRVVFSDLPALRGRSFGMADDLEGALNGETRTEFADGSDGENVFERALAQRLLRAMGATLGQGHFFARPVPADEISTMLRTRSLVVVPDRTRLSVA